MTLCRKCGKEIPDGQELCEECQEAEEMQASGELAGDEDINSLLDMLSQDYEEYDTPLGEEEPEEERMEKPDDSPAETMLFREEDEEEGLFADESAGLSVDDIFDDALSAVDYSASEDEDLDEFIPFGEEETAAPVDEVPEEPELQDDMENALAPDDTEYTSEQAELPSEKKPGVLKKIFGNIITEQSEEEEAKEREKEKEEAEKKSLAREEKKKLTAEQKAEKAEQARLEKERKAEEKAERATVKAAEKEKKKREKKELEEQEVVGKINPLGASIIVVLFGVLCLLVIVGTRSYSYTSSVRNAEVSFEQGDYKTAYEELAGVEVSESADELKEKVRICMQMQSSLDSFQNYYEMKMYLESLDSLMKGIGSYDANKIKAEEFDIMSRYHELESKIVACLYEEFGVSETQARSINSIDDREEYTSRLENIISHWEERNREDER